jgi:hypothetical protein
MLLLLRQLTAAGVVPIGFPTHCTAVPACSVSPKAIGGCALLLLLLLSQLQACCLLLLHAAPQQQQLVLSLDKSLHKAAAAAAAVPSFADAVLHISVMTQQ